MTSRPAQLKPARRPAHHKHIKRPDSGHPTDWYMYADILNDAGCGKSTIERAKRIARSLEKTPKLALFGYGHNQHNTRNPRRSYTLVTNYMTPVPALLNDPNCTQLVFMRPEWVETLLNDHAHAASLKRHHALPGLRGAGRRRQLRSEVHRRRSPLPGRRRRRRHRLPNRPLSREVLQRGVELLLHALVREHAVPSDPHVRLPGGRR